MFESTKEHLAPISAASNRRGTGTMSLKGVPPAIGTIHVKIDLSRARHPALCIVEESL
jgi:hypothetical protein